MKKDLGLFGLVAVAAMFLGGCASGATVEGMTVRSADIKTAPSPDLARSVTVGTVAGGKETQPLWTSQIDNPSFKAALERSLRTAGLLSDDANAKFVVVAELVSLEQPLVAFDMKVVSRVRYSLKDRKSGAVLFTEEVRASYTATVGDALVGTKRLRLANEGSARKSIALLIARLNNSAQGATKTAPPTLAVTSATHSTN